MKRRLLWIGDAGCASGFERGTRYICNALVPEFDVHVIGINYNGDPHEYPFTVWPSYPGGDFMGIGRTKEMIERLGPAVIVIQQDPWNFPSYMQHVGNVPVIGAVAVDGKMCAGRKLNGLNHAIFWTKFGESEANLGGYTGPSSVIPLGVDTSIYKPSDRTDSRERMNLPTIFKRRGIPADAFIVGVVAKNQYRKRLNLSIAYFAEWVHSRNISDAVLWLHVPPTGDTAYKLEEIAEYYGVADRIIRPDIHPIYGVPELSMAKVYSIFDVLFSTTVGEGMGLPALEAMACRILPILPAWSAYGEWATRAAYMVPCSTEDVAPNINTLGGIMDKEYAIDALDFAYTRKAEREAMAQECYELVTSQEFNWEHIGKQYLDVIQGVLRQGAAPVMEQLQTA